MDLIVTRRHYQILRLLTEQETNGDGIRTKYLQANEIVRQLGEKYSRATIYRDLTKLEGLSLLKKSLYSGERRNYYSLSMGAMNLIEKPSSRHSFLLSKVLGDMTNNLSKIRAHYFTNEIAGIELGLDVQSLAPDAILKILTNNKDLVNCGFELELTQKSASRIVAKFNKYIADKYFHRVIYLFEFERDYRKYLSIFTDVISRLQGQEDSKRIITKFLFAYSNDLENDPALIKKTVVNFNFEELTFEELLHDERISYSYVNQTKH